ncbi:MAG TPA: spherulation-specific family 4 protein [Nitrososphaerales archaeon]|nr:spherulation-specific family 4 protein [Nitrososphaerales archaeon]
MTSRERVRSRSRTRTRVLVAVLIISVATLSFLSALIVPLYTYPGVSWTSIIQAKEANPGVAMVTIINPDNGPGFSIDQNYVNGINSLRAAGVVVLGYDHTSYGARPLATVEADINSYKSWYNLSGIFFDEMANVAGYEGYYSALNQYAKSVGFNFTVGNPGSAIPASYIGTMDVIVAYENQGVPNTASLAAMTNGVPANHFAVIAYGVNVWNGSEVSNIYNYASYVYVTNDTLPNPYGALTGDFSKMVTDLSSPFQSSVPLTVKSVDGAGTPIAGVYTVITSTNGAAVASGDTPLTTSVPRGVGYEVSVANYGSFVFKHWDDGGTSASQTVTVPGSTTVTATFGPVVSTTASMTIQSSVSTGAPIAGVPITVTSNGNTVTTGVTPLTFAGTIGASYTVSIGIPNGYIFDDWNGGGTGQALAVALTQNTTLTAFYTMAQQSTSTSMSSTTSTSHTSSTTSTTRTSTTSAYSTKSVSITASSASSTTGSTSVTSSTSSSGSTSSSTNTPSTSTGAASSSTSSTSRSSSASSTGNPTSSSGLLFGIGALVVVVAVTAAASLLIWRKPSGR